MIKGMTGFGSCQVASGKAKILIEIRSVNHRYADINFYLPNGFISIEDKIRQVLVKEIERGRVTISIKVIQKPDQTVLLNKSVIGKYLGVARVLRQEFKVKGELTVAELLKLSGVVEVKEDILDVTSLWPTLETGIRRALAELAQMRKREGASLAADLKNQLSGMSKQLKLIRIRAKALIKQKRKILPAEEFSSYQKGADVNEEIARLMHYMEECRKFFKAQVPVGKKLDFIAQEMQRETNTIGSKLMDQHVSSAVIALKSKIEKIREQVQNVE